MFTLTVDIAGARQKIETLAERAEDLETPLARFGGYLKKRALKRYEEQSFAPLAESTVLARAGAGKRSLERKLFRDYKRATKRAGDRAGGGGIMGTLVGQASRGARNRLAVLATYQRQHGFKLHALASGAGVQPLSVKQAASLDARTQRAVERSVGAPILGQLPRSLVVEVERDSVTLTSRTHEHWTEAHNEGATVGRGAKLPKRETIKLEPQDLEVFASILKDHFLLESDGRLGPGY